MILDVTGNVINANADPTVVIAIGGVFFIV